MVSPDLLDKAAHDFFQALEEIASERFDSDTVAELRAIQSEVEGAWKSGATDTAQELAGGTRQLKSLHHRNR